MTQSSNESDKEPGHASAPGPETQSFPPGGGFVQPPSPPAPVQSGMPGAPAAPPAAPVEGFKLPAGLNPARWWTGAVAGVGAYVAVLLLSLVTTLLFVMGLAASGSGDSVSVPSNPIVSDGDLPSPWSVLFQFAAQLPALGLMGSLGGKIDADMGMFGQLSATFGAFVMPLLITAAAVAALFIGGRVAEKRLPSGTALDRLMQSVAAGAAFSLVLNLVATIASIRIPAGSELVFSLNAANAASIVVAFMLGVAASFLGRSRAAAAGQANPRKRFALSLLRDAGLTVTAHAAVFLVVSIPVIVIVLGIKSGWLATLSAPLWAPTVGLFLLGLGHFAAFGTVTAAGSGSGTGIGSSNFGYGMGSALSDFGIPAWTGWLLVLLALLAVAVAAIYWYLRRGTQSPTSILGWTALPAAFLAAGALLLWVSGIHASFAMAQGSGLISIGLAWWTPFLMLLWGVVTEAAARYLAPKVAPLLPAALVARIQRKPSVLELPRAGVPAAGHGAVPGTAATPEILSAGPPPAPGTPVTVEHTPLSKKAKRNLILAGGAVALVVVLVGGGAMAANVVRANNGPDKVVQEYLAALVDGNAEHAMAVADPSISNASRVLMTNEIYGKAKNRPDGFTVLKTSVERDAATVLVELRQNGVKSQTTYQLVKTNPTLLNNNWTLQGTGGAKSLGTGSVAVQLGSKLSTILVNGVEVSLAGLDQQGGSMYQLPALPGTYTLGLPETSKYLSAEPATAVVSIQGDGMGQLAELKPTPNAAFDTAVQEQVSALLKACAEQKTLKPEACPFSAYEYSDTRDVSWKITKEPTFDVYSSQENTWSLSTNDAGEAAASYERDTSFGSSAPEWKKDTYDARIYLQGVITVDKDKLAVKFTD